MISDILKHHDAFNGLLYPEGEGTRNTCNSGNYNCNNMAKLPRKLASYLHFLSKQWHPKTQAGILS
jgi:hypothetical protein